MQTLPPFSTYSLSGVHSHKNVPICFWPVSRETSPLPPGPTAKKFYYVLQPLTLVQMHYFLGYILAKMYPALGVRLNTPESLHFDPKVCTPHPVHSPKPLLSLEQYIYTTADFATKKPRRSEADPNLTLVSH